MNNRQHHADKALLRKTLRQRRRALPAADQQNAARRLAQRLQHLPQYRRAKNIACYLASDGEIATTVLLRANARQQKHHFLPVVGPGRQLRFARYRWGQPLRRNRYGISEPRRSAETKSLIEMDMVLLPLVGFDRRGHRLGMGGGYYDAALGQIPPRQRPLLIGLAHACQQVDTLPLEPWDINLDLVVTDAGVLRPTRRR